MGGGQHGGGGGCGFSLESRVIIASDNSHLFNRSVCPKQRTSKANGTVQIYMVDKLSRHKSGYAELPENPH